MMSCGVDRVQCGIWMGGFCSKNVNASATIT